MKRKIYWTTLLIVSILVGWAVFFHYYPVEEIVSDIGVQNTYLATFLLAAIGGFSSVTGTSLYAALVALSKGGMSPLVLGVIAGWGLFLSDTLFYFIASKVRRMISGATDKWERLFRNMWKWIYRTPSWMVYGGIFLYVAFIPVPNDILLAVLALSKYSYRQFAPFIFLGDLTVAVLLTTFGGSLSVM